MSNVDLIYLCVQYVFQSVNIPEGCNVFWRDHLNIFKIYMISEYCYKAVQQHLHFPWNREK